MYSNISACLWVYPLKNSSNKYGGNYEMHISVYTGNVWVCIADVITCWDAFEFVSFVY
jgi:hypothetical protein